MPDWTTHPVFWIPAAAFALALAWCALSHRTKGHPVLRALAALAVLAMLAGAEAVWFGFIEDESASRACTGRACLEDAKFAASFAAAFAAAFAPMPQRLPAMAVPPPAKKPVRPRRADKPARTAPAKTPTPAAGAGPPAGR